MNKKKESRGSEADVPNFDDVFKGSEWCRDVFLGNQSPERYSFGSNSVGEGGFCLDVVLYPTPRILFDLPAYEFDFPLFFNYGRTSAVLDSKKGEAGIRTGQVVADAKLGIEYFIPVDDMSSPTTLVHAYFHEGQLTGIAADFKIPDTISKEPKFYGLRRASAMPSAFVHAVREVFNGGLNAGAGSVPKIRGYNFNSFIDLFNRVHLPNSHRDAIRQVLEGRRE